MRNVPPARIVNIVAGVWLFISAFLWTHTSAQMTNTWIVGLLAAIVAAVGIRVPEARWANAALGVWLFISVFALPTIAAATFWNNLLVAVVMFIAALVPNETGTAARVHEGRGLRRQRPATV